MALGAQKDHDYSGLGLGLATNRLPLSGYREAERQFVPAWLSASTRLGEKYSRYVNLVTAINYDRMRRTVGQSLDAPFWRPEVLDEGPDRMLVELANHCLCVAALYREWSHDWREYESTHAQERPEAPATELGPYTTGDVAR